MAKIFLSEVPCTDEFLEILGREFPQVEPFSFYTYLTVRKVTTDLDNALDGYFNSYGLSAGRFMLLMILDSNREGMMPSALAAQCGVTQATISGLLNGLEKAQLVIRESHNHDGRAYVIKMAEKGIELMSRIKPEFLDCINKFMGRFSMEEKKAMVTLMGRFGDELKLLTHIRADRVAATT